MLRIAALASTVVASTPMVLPFSSPEAPSRATRNDDAQHKAEYLLLRFDRHQPAGGRKGGMTGAALVESNSRKGADPERIGGPPGDATLRMDAREIADQEGAEADARGEAGPSHLPGVELPGGGFGELGEFFGFEQFVEAGVEGVGGG
jgi:hypothetical protein